MGESKSFRPSQSGWWVVVCSLVAGACGGSAATGPSSVEAGSPADGSASSEDAPLDTGGSQGAVDAPADHAGPDATGGPDASDASDAPVALDASDAALSTDASLACVPAGSCSLSFLSGPDWAAYSGSVSSTAFTLGTALGPAVDVCLNASDPANCPSGAFSYVYATSGMSWTGGQSFPQAYWIWRPDVSLSAPSSMQVAIFQKPFVVGPNATGSLQIAVDDFAAVFVNGVPIGSIGSLTDTTVAGPAHSAPTTLDFTAALRTGVNVVVVAAENGPFGCSSSACPYSQDPAGVVFQGTLRW
jgi:hypothetical protein